MISVFADNAVAEVDPRTRQVIDRVKACTGPQGLSYLEGQLWVACTSSGELADLSPRSGHVVRRTADGSADGVTSDGPSLLVTSDNGPSVAVSIRAAEGFRT